MNYIQKNIGETLNRLEIKCTEIGLGVEKRCRKIIMGVVDFSSDTNMLGKT